MYIIGYMFHTLDKQIKCSISILHIYVCNIGDYLNILMVREMCIDA